MSFIGNLFQTMRHLQALPSTSCLQFLLCNSSVPHVVLSITTVTRDCFHLCVDGYRTTKSFEDSCVNILRGILHPKKYIFSAVYM